ncbi:hypothetical protein ABDX87_20040 [Pseudomonas abietaniphila]|uniref:hypothetical protein n=1 Tax=Pseudomonas abietaniphila TaxID=89065 RepID=UPI0032170DB3
MFANLETLSVIDVYQLQGEFPDTSFPPDLSSETLSDFGYVVLEYDPVPQLGLGEHVEAGEVRREGDRVIRGWTIVPPSESELTSLYEQAVQAKLNGAAQDRGYDSISTAISYAEEPAVPKFQKDGKAFRAWRSMVWAYAYEQLAAVKAGEREQPSVDAFLQELPTLDLPA